MDAYSLRHNCVEESARGGRPDSNSGFEPGIIIRQLGTRRACSGQRHVESAVSTYRYLICGCLLSGRINNVELSTFCVPGDARLWWQLFLSWAGQVFFAG
jgi:hypothetical protein